MFSFFSYKWDLGVSKQSRVSVAVLHLDDARKPRPLCPMRHHSQPTPSPCWLKLANCSDFFPVVSTFKSGRRGNREKGYPLSTLLEKYTLHPAVV